MADMGSVLVAGKGGLIGSACFRALEQEGIKNVYAPSRSELDYQDLNAFISFLKKNKISKLIFAVGKVGGIVDNMKLPADYITENIVLHFNAIRAAQAANVEKAIFFGSSCVYPADAAQPLDPSQLFAGKPEVTSLSYAVSKLATILACQSHNRQYPHRCLFIPIIPNTAYGPNDHFDETGGHVLSALMQKIHKAKMENAKSVVIWGSGKPLREFIHSSDIAKACIFLLKAELNPDTFPLNLSSSVETSISELAQKIAKVVGFSGELVFDTTRPDGAYKKSLNCETMATMGWECSMDLDRGLQQTYQWFLENEKTK